MPRCIRNDQTPNLDRAVAIVLVVEAAPALAVGPSRPESTARASSPGLPQVLSLIRSTIELVRADP